MKRSVQSIHRPPAPHWVGNGFPVRTLFSYHLHGAHISPFLLLDHAGPAEFAPGGEQRGVGAHPHRGFETVTIVYDGEVAHRDSSGGGGTIGPGEVQWMTAARGVLHDEFHSAAFTHRGGTLEMVQLWVNLPARHKLDEPRYQALTQADIPAVTLPAGAGRVRVIAGEFGGQHGAAQTFTPVTVLDAQLQHGGAASFGLPAGHTAMVMVVRGSARVQGEPVHAGQLARLSREGDFEVVADTDATLLVLGGEPIDEPIAGHGPFVMNSKEELQEAFAAYASGGFGRLTANP